VIRRLTPAWRLRATLAAFMLPLFVYLLPLDRIARWISRGPVRSSPNDAVDDRALAEWVDRVLNRLPPPWRRTCLKRALVLHYLVRCAGRPTELRIGVRRDEHNALAAHAWLVRDNLAYLEPGTDHVASYQVLTAFSSVGEVDR
jgi:hypothetical protein